MKPWLEMTREQRRAHVLPLWDQGKSAGEIALTLNGASRNAVIGTISRSGHKRSVIAKATPNPKKRMGKRPTYPVAIRQPVAQANAVRVVAVAPERRGYGDREPLPGTKPITMLELPNRVGVACRFPVVGGYCGCPCGDRMYCPDHYPLVYRAVKETTDA